MKKIIASFGSIFIAVISFVSPSNAQQSGNPCALLCNSNFEQPVVLAGSGRFVPKCDVPCWKTTDNAGTGSATCPNGQIEFWRGTVGPGPNSGNQFVELNATTQAKLYQDFNAVPGNIVTISYAHAGRSGYSNNMRVSLGTSITDPSPTLLGNYVGVVNTWNRYSSTLPLPSSSSGNYTLIFETLDSGPGGNFLDSITVNCPDSPLATFDPCCPPWNKNILKDLMFYYGQGSISLPYTLHFEPTILFNNQMYAYINYLHSVNSSINAITINWRLSEQGTGISPTAGYGIGATSPVNITWNAGSTGTPLPLGFFTGFPMIVGTWYRIHTGIYLNNEIRYFPVTCDNNDIYVRIQLLTDRSSKARVLEYSDGKNVIDRVPIKDKAVK